MFINPKITKSADELRADSSTRSTQKRILLNTPKNTQSVLMLIAAAALATGKP